MPARWKAADLVECLAKRSLAHRKDATQSGNVKWLIYIDESQLFSLFDEIAARCVFPREGRPLLRSSDLVMHSHGNPPGEAIHPGPTHHRGSSSDIVLWGKSEFAQTSGEAQR